MTRARLYRAAKEQARGGTTTPFQHLISYAASPALVKSTANAVAPLVRLGGSKCLTGGEGDFEPPA